MDKDFFKKCCLFSLSFLLTISVGIVIFFIFYNLEGVKESIDNILTILRPIIYGSVFAYLLRPICNTLEHGFLLIFTDKERKKKKIYKKKEPISLVLAITFSLLSVILVLYLLIDMVIPQLVTSVPLLITTIFDAINEMINYIQEHKENEIYSLIINYLEQSDLIGGIDATKWIDTYITPYVTTIVSTVSASVLNIVFILKDLLIGLIIAVYILVYKRKLGKQAKLILKAIVPKKWFNTIYEEIIFADKTLNGFLVGKIVDSLIIGVLAYISLTLLKMPFTPLVSIIIGVTNIIPFFGPFIGAIPSAIIIFVESPVKALIFIIFIFILQQFDGNILGPKILGDATGVSSFWVLFSILIFGGLFGVPGMILGIPIFAVIYDIAKKLVYHLLNKKGESKAIRDYEEDKKS